jgi:hypothetical protein
MNNGFQWWLVIVGICLGAGLLWLVLGRLPRQDDDVGPRERQVEAMWISQTIEAGGGVAPVALIEEVLELHASYLDGPALIVDEASAAEAAARASAPAGSTADDGLPGHDRPPATTATAPGPAMDAAPSTPAGPDTPGGPATSARPATLAAGPPPPRQIGRGSVGDGAPMQRHDARRETPEADVRQPG